MMTDRIGVDIIHVDKIRKALEQDNPAYFRSIYTEEELRIAQSNPQPVFYYASRFAAKEAVFKAFGTAWEDEMDWTQIQILSNPSGGLMVELHGKFADVAKAMGIASISVSVSYDTDYAIAAALIT